MDDLTRERFAAPSWRERTGTTAGPTLEALQAQRRRDLLAATRDYHPSKRIDNPTARVPDNALREVADAA